MSFPAYMMSSESYRCTCGCLIVFTAQTEILLNPFKCGGLLISVDQIWASLLAVGNSRHFA